MKRKSPSSGEIGWSGEWSVVYLSRPEADPDPWLPITSRAAQIDGCLSHPTSSLVAGIDSGSDWKDPRLWNWTNHHTDELQSYLLWNASQMDRKGSRSEEKFGFLGNPVDNQFSRQPWIREALWCWFWEHPSEMLGCIETLLWNSIHGVNRRRFWVSQKPSRNLETGSRNPICIWWHPYWLDEAKSNEVPPTAMTTIEQHQLWF